MNAAWLLICGAAFGATLIGHALVCRLSLKLNRVGSFVMVASVMALFMVTALARRYEVLSVESLAALLMFAFACELYVFLFTMTISSISANALVRLAHRPMAIEEAMSAYDSSNMVRMRLERLIGGSFIRVVAPGSRLLLSPKGVRLTKAFSGLRRLFLS
jgi:hypothetical protein